jgi:hypothetical protein
VLTKNWLWTCEVKEDSPFEDFVRYAFNKVKDLSREDLLIALKENDPNGVWTDEDSTREFGRPVTKAEVIQHYAVALAGDFPLDWKMLTWDELLKF